MTLPIPVLYTVPGCSLCAHTRNWFVRHGIEYTERDVAAEFGALRRMYKLTKSRLVPVIEVGSCVAIRPSEEQLRNLFTDSR